CFGCLHLIRELFVSGQLSDETQDIGDVVLLCGANLKGERSNRLHRRILPRPPYLTFLPTRPTARRARRATPSQSPRRQGHASMAQFPPAVPARIFVR